MTTFQGFYYYSVYEELKYRYPHVVRRVATVGSDGEHVHRVPEGAPVSGNRSMRSPARHRIGRLVAIASKPGAGPHDSAPCQAGGRVALQRA